MDTNNNEGFLFTIEGEAIMLPIDRLGTLMVDANMACAALALIGAAVEDGRIGFVSEAERVEVLALAATAVSRARSFQADWTPVVEAMGGEFR